MSRPVRYIPASATTLHDASGGVVSQQIFIDSWGANSLYRWLGASHTAGYKIVSSSFPCVNNPSAGFNYGTLGEITGGGAGNWTSSAKVLGDAWGSDSNTDEHINRGVQLSLGGVQSGTTELAAWLLNVSDWGIPANDASSSNRAQITFRIFYRKEGLSSNCELALATCKLVDTVGNDQMGEVIVGGNSGQTLLTLESGSGIGYVEHTVDNSSFWLGSGSGGANNTTNVGVCLIAHASGTIGGSPLTDPPVSGDNIEIVGVQWFLSEGSAGSKHLSSTHAATGVVQFWNQRDGYDASEMLDNQADSVRLVQIQMASEILGDGTVDSAAPIDIVSWYGGHNKDLTRGYIAGIEALFDGVSSQCTGAGLDAPGTRELFTQCNFSLDPTRMRTQARAGYSKARSSGWLWSDGYAMFRGKYPDATDLPANDLYDIAYPTMEMDSHPTPGGTHPNSSANGQATIEYVVAQHYKMTNPSTPEVLFRDGTNRGSTITRLFPNRKRIR